MASLTTFESYLECNSCCLLSPRESFHRLVVVRSVAAPVCDACAGYQTHSPLTLPDSEARYFQAAVGLAIQGSIREAIQVSQQEATEISSAVVREIQNPHDDMDDEEFASALAALEQTLNGLRIGGGQYDDDSDIASQSDWSLMSDVEYDGDRMSDFKYESDGMSEVEYELICHRRGAVETSEYHVNPDVTHLAGGERGS
ncbi:hypothetical protein B0T22DRAFT_485243 [Podospora appendiculata]|uniref:Uncharacterized protein n=1 Tax=Podospora appendiculata TaxID=314037 RepID=A0AAE0X076_9PEZI|nr:hypothetical protein B0T22DRAFT_485243 [Podospora appendiculata]